MSETKTIYEYRSVNGALNTPIQRATTKEITVSASDSIEIDRDAKGVYRWSIKMYFEPGLYTEALARIEMVDKILRVTYQAKEQEQK